MPSARWSQYDTDYERLPTGMTRIGYDADDQTYTFRATDGSVWESAPGNQYGPLRCASRSVSAPVSGTLGDSNDGDDDELPPYAKTGTMDTEVSWRVEMMPLLNLFMIVGLFLIGVFFYLRHAAAKMDRKVEPLKCGPGHVQYSVRPGDTCWALSNDRGVSIEALLKENASLDCDKLMAGQTICVPST